MQNEIQVTPCASQTLEIDAFEKLNSKHNAGVLPVKRAPGTTPANSHPSCERFLAFTDDITPYVRLWHFSEIPPAPTNVCYRR